MEADDDRVPSYYKSSYLHWDFAIKVPLGYLEGCTTKYVARWRKKEGLKDLHKALHYLDKLIQGANFNIYRDNIKVDEEVERFSVANDLDPLESQYIFIMCTYRNEKALKSARQILVRIIVKAEQEQEARSTEEINRPGTPEDGGHHSRQQS
jgi:hypothetical protein